MGELKHFLHEHQLILNEAEPVVGKEVVVCDVCRLPINKRIDAFYRCDTSLTDASPSSDCVGFFMHKTCSELPSTFTHPMKPKHPLTLRTERPYRKQESYSCYVCDGDYQGFMYASDDIHFKVCLKCVTYKLKSREHRKLKVCHPAHNHPLTLVQSPALFLCHACNTTATDVSYICTRCGFWIHKSCATAPSPYQSKFHNEHSLKLDYSLPQQYRTFFFYCSICDGVINPIHWVYYCANCRFFAHVKCASLSISSTNEIEDEAHCGESNLLHFPVHDEASLHETMQQCIIKATNANSKRHLLSTIIGPISTSWHSEPSPFINHWTHKHQLALGNKNAETRNLDLNSKLAETKLLICDGCTNPISLVDIFYECNLCKFFLHRSCAQFPNTIKHHLVAGKLGGVVPRELGCFKCQGCDIWGNGIFMRNKKARLDIGCASLPRIIKHEGHRHPLNQLKPPDDLYCKACQTYNSVKKKQETIIYGCGKCEFYIHIWCALRPHLVKHRWDPHPLYLILFLKNVADHPHEFQCELCSEEINPNSWFYHCKICDLSFHTYCVDPYYHLSNIKLGATNFYSDSHPHPHGLTYVLNEKKRSCEICGDDVCGYPVLECSPCRYVVDVGCFGANNRRPRLRAAHSDR